MPSGFGIGSLARRWVLWRTKAILPVHRTSRQRPPHNWLEAGKVRAPYFPAKILRTLFILNYLPRVLPEMADPVKANIYPFSASYFFKITPGRRTVAVKSSFAHTWGLIPS